MERPAWWVSERISHLLILWDTTYTGAEDAALPVLAMHIIINTMIRVFLVTYDCITSHRLKTAFFSEFGPMSVMQKEVQKIH